MTHKRSLTVRVSIVVLALVSGLSSLLLPLNASAAVLEGWYSVGSGVSQATEGYFSNNGASDVEAANRQRCPFLRCPVLYNEDYAVDALNGGYYRQGNNDTTTSIQRARDLVADLRARYNNEVYTSYEEWNQTGAAFIVNTMLGYGIDDSRKSRTVTSAMWTDLENRLVSRATQDRINWNIDFDTDGKDTYVRRILNSDGVWRYDVVYNGENYTRNGLIIYNDDGSEAYRLWYLCANPVGNMTGLPELNYNLNPSVTGTPNYSESGGTVTVSPTINNTGTTASSSAQWQLTQFTIPASSPPNPIPSGAPNNTIPVTHYGYNSTTIASGNRTFPTNLTPVATGPRVLPDEPVGTRICYALSVQPLSQSDGRWRHSNPFCVTIAKSPKLTVTGGDVLVGKGATSNIVTSVNRKNVGGADRTFGSWGEYAVAASGSISGMASGGGYSTGNPSNVFCAVSYLTITNAGAGSCTTSTPKGSYSMAAALPAVSTRFTQATPAGASPTFDAAAQTGVFSATGIVTVRSGGATNGTLVINAPTATVRITDNIVYNNGPFSSISQLPQVVIIANRIEIEGDVGQIDAWLVASGADGTIVTCSDVADATALRSTNCGNRLTVNGPVMARHLLLYRTAGSGTGAQSAEPAEVFNLRPDAYLWATNYNAGSKRLQTLSTTELPPRF